jgi:hypothetical protein
MTQPGGVALDPQALLGQLTPVPEEDLACGRPEIRADGRQLDEVTAEALEALQAANQPPWLFQRGGALVRVRVDPQTDNPYLETLGVDALRGVLARAATWYVERPAKGGPVRVGVSPPNDVVKDLLTLPGWPAAIIPPLVEVVECPTFAADGTLIDQPGYCAATRLWYRPAPGLVVPPVPAAPQKRSVGLATCLLLNDLMRDFPFADQASRANALALLLLPFVRGLIDGPTPLHLIEAARPGTGKGLLADVIHIVATGRPASATAEVGDGDEWRKRVFAALLEGPRFVVIDNISGYFDSGALASALTARSIKDRLLQTSRMAEAPVRCVWIGTGNNVRMSSELARRTPLIRLVATVDRPWMRPAEEFRHPELVRWALAKRGALVHAALTLCRAWFAAGRPAGQVAVGSYESWAQVMGGILEVINVPGFMANAPEALDHANDDQAKWTALVECWWQHFEGAPVCTGQLYPLVASEGLLEGVLGDGNEPSRRVRLGRALGKQRDACYGGRRILAVGKAHNGATLYSLKPLTVGPDPAAGQ